MKNIKAIGLIFLALLFGLAAAVYATGWISRQSGIASNKVVVAAVDIDLGSRVNAQMLSTVDWPSGSVPNGSFSDIKALNDRVVKVGVLRGEALMEGKLAPVGTQGGLSAVIASGKRAMTVRVNDVVGVAGFALPGNYVDVMVNAQQDKGRGEDALQISKTVLEKVLVLAVAQEANRDDTKPKVVSAVTLELSLEDSEKLDLARSVGTLSLVLRNQMDKTTVATLGITKGQLFGEKKDIVPVSTAAAPARPRMRQAGPVTPRASECVEVIQHAGRSLTCF
ncbi:pilus assembly protein CpaB [Variovorax boronicumulans]|uniref:Pilus assembly protein CpaB n=1 Tax=Variovorax boronicumulans TaxID=436515 RepID=A0AAW8DP34_9BURK|nr:Flp pilus assembly protein CpaB [Variovorax boronicumulans]MDP9875903.1 pilus assembly protein CpaB [Variovorax boronicumulans]MDP9917176.1 pilus assembly protein CpaB [Variovorax boronicumulans]MDP9921187.1 pilus assembly protein CpaB [Variovorax boronicumulans]